MILKEVEFNNYMCYYGIKKFRFAEGLNIILGKNGDGKTKFFEGIQWLFGDLRATNIDLVSAKALKELDEEGKAVWVQLTCDLDVDVITISKSFRVVKDGDDYYATKESIKVVRENIKGERTPITDPAAVESIIKSVFPSTYRKYSLFKGEEELMHLNSSDSLTTLINLFSDSRLYDKYIKVGEYSLKKAEKTISDEAKKNKKLAVELVQLDSKIERIVQDITTSKTIISEREKNVDSIERRKAEIEAHIGNAEKLQILNERINKLDDRIRQEKYLISENERYTTNLFDEKWITMYFEPFHQEYSLKTATISKERRKQQQEYDKNQGIKEGKKRAKEELLGTIPLPIGTPSKAHMEEMLHEKVCKVCNRTAPEGSEAYEYMYNRLQEFLKSQTEEKEEEEKKLYKYNYLRKLENMAESYEEGLSDIRNIENDISDSFDFISLRKKLLADHETKREKEIKERDELIGSSTLNVHSLSDVLKNYTGYQKDLTEDNKTLLEYKNSLKKLEEELAVLKADKEAKEKETVNSFLIDTKNIIADIAHIFEDTRRTKFDEFLVELEQRSDSLFKQANEGSFTGKIVFRKKEVGDNIQVSIDLLNSDDRDFSPNKGMETMMNVSVLLAISSIVKEKEAEAYPIIMDAPTSPFDKEKRDNFFAVMKESTQQAIIITKDFISKDEVNDQYFIDDEFENISADKAYWIKLDEGFEAEMLHTINTLVTEL